MRVTVPDYPKVIICVAPHTSNWDFLMGELALRSVGRKAGFLMKADWFFWPIGAGLRAMGGIPVYRGKKKGEHGSLVEQMIRRFDQAQTLHVAITPEGTRSRTSQWHTGFLRIAYEAKIPIVLGVLDYRDRYAQLMETFLPTGNVSADIEAIKRYYSPYRGKYPKKFSTDPQ